MDAQLTQKMENAMNAFETFKSDLTPKLDKLDAFDAGKLATLEKAMGDAIELTQKEAGARKALEDQVKAMETALSRPAASNPATDEKAFRAKSKKLFNEFARQKDDANKQYFDVFLEKRAETDPEVKTLSAGSDPNGGYLVMPEMGGVIQTYVYESSPIRQLASVTSIGTDTLEYILDNDANTSGWVGEQTARTATATPTLGKLTIYVNELYSNPPVTQKLLDDAQFDVEGWLSRKVAEEFGRKEATAFVSGSGVNQPKGIMSYTSGTTVASQQIEQVVSGSASTFTYDGLVNLQNALKEEYQSNASFLIRRASNSYLMLIKDGEGRPIFNMSFDKNVGLQPTLMGQPVYFAADVAAVASNALAMAYGDFRRAYQIVDRSGIRVLRDPYTSKPNVLFYTTKRVGGAVVNFEAIKIGKIST
ncbi:phage major capsid protein [Zavarzinella formosa]|uniref:phage major capsid protein n=1 Tax=Zavarzinella formosa TaxID=360055 RepID=UPI0002EFC36A|nr:phage major capsid protein [Zavarzinella formosa]